MFLHLISIFILMILYTFLKYLFIYSMAFYIVVTIFVTKSMVTYCI